MTGDGRTPGRSSDQPRPAPGLYVVSTPIGHARDITLRAIDILSAADVIAAEDTRVTGKLLQRYGIATALTPYHDHNAAQAGPRLIERLNRGEIVALVSDAGTPLLSDPGFRLVRQVLDAGLPVIPVPGPSALTAALAVAGLPTDRVLFLGFIARSGRARKETLAEAAGIRATVVLYESPQRLAATLAELAEVMGPREAAVARELTKLYEEVRRDTLPALAAHYAEQGPPKGEIVILVAPPGEAEAPSEEEIEALLRAALAEHSLKQAVAEVANATGVPRRTVYSLALALKDEA